MSTSGSAANGQKLWPLSAYSKETQLDGRAEGEVVGAVVGAVMGALVGALW